MILEKDSSILGYPGEKSKPLDADHHNMCKYESPQDPNYVAVRNTLQSLIAKIVSTDTPNVVTSVHGDLKFLRCSLGITEMPDTDYIFFRDQWSEGTCHWLLDEESYTDWLGPPTPTSSFVWLFGGAASGKSVLSSFIINNLVENRLSCQYFFVRFGDNGKRTLSLLLRSIAYQIALDRPELLKRIRNLQDQGTDFETASPRTIWERVFKGIIFNIEGDKPLYWIIDGLDEADDPRAVMKLLSEVHRSSVPIRILFMSRETAEISASFRKLPPELGLRCINIEGHGEDLSYYVQQELALSGDDAFREYVSRTIVRESQNNFLVSAVYLDSLAGGIS